MTAPKRRRFPRGMGLRETLSGANGCLAMVRETLEDLGLSMNGCAPMFYDDAVRQVASILGRKAGLKTWEDVRTVVREHEAERAAQVNG